MTTPSERIAEELRQRITRGELKAGDPVPSTRALVRTHDIAMATATKVLSTLREEGLVIARPGRGTVVAEPQRRRPPTRTEPQPTAQPARDLSRERIVEAAIRLADTEGLKNLTMRRVAGELDVATMSLYRHIPTKEQLIAEMSDACYAEMPLPEPPPADWREALTAFSRVQWDAYHRHPWMAQVTSFARPTPAPRGMAVTDWGMRALAGYHLDIETAALIAITVSGLTRGFAVDLEAEIELRDLTGQDADAYTEAHGAEYEKIMKEHGLTALVQMAAPDLDLTLDSFYRFSLERYLDGLEPLLNRRRKGQASARKPR
ncbi:hypothetical protein BIV57_02715 [Mangrovactinospora gilvigrisea]|uniref:GntR family transcriptional regulator n=1 Tax=Mangrovactinospora gilvigrisea TaxID=1428644 RepID=A0A1J7BK23_9ACTN|nr:GntR family transcriptional regulator [Mangrovactinospora gilvigrisea]OIV39035.1 hypothetical protein BIV57_02715 [Mangrovactinospora gilvigrisea]